MVNVLLDTNIVIYLLDRKEPYMSYMDTLVGQSIGISIISFMEVLVGIRSRREIEEANVFLEEFEIVPLTMDIARTSAMALRRSQKKSLRSPRMADIIIGQTALMLGVPLVTNNSKDFRSIRGLQLLVP